MLSTCSRLILLVIFLLLLGCSDDQQPALKGECQPTPFDEIGPFYRPNSPVRAKVGKGYHLTGTVLSAGDCRPLAGARIEFWLVNSQGEYDDAHRATVFSDRQGKYRFESNRPIDYINRQPHIHMMVTAKEHEQLITQHYPEKNTKEARFDLILTEHPSSTSREVRTAVN